MNYILGMSLVTAFTVSGPGCEGDHEEAKQKLIGAGYDNVVIEGRGWWALNAGVTRNSFHADNADANHVFGIVGENIKYDTIILTNTHDYEM